MHDQEALRSEDIEDKMLYTHPLEDQPISTGILLEIYIPVL